MLTQIKERNSSLYTYTGSAKLEKCDKNSIYNYSGIKEVNIY